MDVNVFLAPSFLQRKLEHLQKLNLSMMLLPKIKEPILAWLEADNVSITADAHLFVDSTCIK